MPDLNAMAQRLIAAANQHEYSTLADEQRVQRAVDRRRAGIQRSRLGTPGRIAVAVGMTLVTAGTAAHMAVQHLRSKAASSPPETS